MAASPPALKWVPLASMPPGGAGGPDRGEVPVDGSALGADWSGVSTAIFSRHSGRTIASDGTCASCVSSSGKAGTNAALRTTTLR